MDENGWLQNMMRNTEEIHFFCTKKYIAKDEYLWQQKLMYSYQNKGFTFLSEGSKHKRR